MNDQQGIRLPMIRAVIVGAGLTLTASLAHANPNVPTATLTVSGNVNAFAQIYVESVSGNTGFDLTTNQTATQIATVRERSNRRTGYKVMVTSANLTAGRCSNNTKPCFYSSLASENLIFDIYKGASGTPLLLESTPTGNTGNWTTAIQKTTGLGISNAVRIAFDGSQLSLGDASDYTETLTFTIAANP